MTMEELLNGYNWLTDERGMHEIKASHAYNKKALINLLSKHPLYNPDTMQIVLPVTMERTVDKNYIYKYFDIIYNAIKIPKEIVYTHKYADVMRYINNINTKLRSYYALKLSDNNVAQMIEDLPRYVTLKQKYEDNCKITALALAFDKEEYEKFYNNRKIIETLQNYKLKTVDELLAKFINERLSSNTKIAQPGMKTSRLVQKVLKLLDLPLFEYQKYCDAINPIMQKFKMVISINPIDYLTMSFGNEWASCHTIDKENFRACNNTYSGQYCSGTISYMLDKSTVMVYFVKDSVNENYELADKIKRCCFYIDAMNGDMIQSRVYPDGRDNPKINPAKEIMRHKMEEVISQCLQFDNSFKISQNGSYHDIVDTYGTHYADYNEYDDAILIRPKHRVEQKIEPFFEIGHDPVCIWCGNEHDNSSTLYCDDCANNVHKCDGCGELFMEDDDRCNNHDNEGRWFCSEACAEGNGMVWSCYEGHYISKSDAFYDNYDEDWYLFDMCEVTTDDDTYYASTENAENDGYVYSKILDTWLREELAKWDKDEEDWLRA